jgi:hypothetical protein
LIPVNQMRNIFEIALGYPLSLDALANLYTDIYENAKGFVSKYLRFLR